MLNALRENIGGWVAKIFIGLLALSFAVWGISDVFTSRHTDALAVVGEHEVSRTEYEFAFQRRIRNLSQQFGQTFTADQARDLGIHRIVLGELIRDAALDSEVSDLRLAVSDETIAESIAQSPIFQDDQGRFNRQMLQQMLLANGLDEPTFLALQRRNLLREELGSIVSGGLYVPTTLLEAMAQQREETRVVKFIDLPSLSISDIDDPTVEQQRAYHEENKRNFTAPEYRTLTVLRLEPEDIAESLSVSDEEVRQAYDQRIADFTTAETREIQQIPFDTLEDAQAALDRIRQGVDFVTVAEERGLKPIDYNLGQLQKNEIADETIAEAAFALQEGEVSAPVEGKLSIVLLRAVDVQPETRRTFEEVRPEIEARLGLERAQEEILNLLDSIEDARAEGGTLDEIGQKFDLPVITVDAVDRSGNDPQGNPIADIPASSAVLRVAFESDIGIENDPIDTPAEGFAWVDVVEITPPAIRPFEDVQDEIVELWKQRTARDRLLERAQAYLQRLQAGEPMQAIAEELSTTVRLSEPLDRRDTPDALGATAVSNIFRTPVDGFAIAPTADGSSFVLIQVVSAETPSFNAQSAEAQALRQDLARGITDDLFQRYVSGLQQEIGVEINEEIWRQLHGEAS